MDHPVRYLGLFFVAIPCVLLCVGTFSSALLRTVRLPICPSCRRPKVRPAHRATVVDRVMTAIHLFPFRCQACLKRFYAFDGRRPHIHQRTV